MKNKNIKIKICGLKRKEDIDLINQCSPDFIGFVFAESSRKINYNDAKTMKNRLNKNIKAVGVFVNENMEFIKKLIKNNVIDMIQLHGNEDEEYIKELKEFDNTVAIIKAVEVKNKEDTELWNNSTVDYLLLDSGKGSGKKFDWNLIGNVKKPFFLAGGITTENIVESSKIYPYAIDVSSGAEENGFKSTKKVKEIIKIMNNINKN